MAKREAWSVRSSSDRRRTLGRFAGIYGLISIVAIAFGWVAIAIIFGLGTVGLVVALYSTGEAPEPPPRPTPEWMRSLDDPDAPDLSLPEYRERRDPGDAPPDGPATASSDDPGAPPPPTPTA